MLTNLVGKRVHVARYGSIALLSVGALVVGAKYSAMSSRDVHAAVDEARTTQDVTAAAPLLIPALQFMGPIDVCRSWVVVQNVGSRDTTAVLVVWSQPPGGGACPGPMQAECSGLLAPGSSWHFIGSQMPSGSASAIVYSVEPYAYSQLQVAGRSPDLAGSHICETVFFGTVGNCDSFADFHEAYLTGGTFQGLPLSQIRGAAIVATVFRHCPSDLTPGAEASSSYQGMPLVPAAMADPGGAGHTATAFTARHGEDSSGPFAYVQSGAPEGATLEIAVRPVGDSTQWTACLQSEAFLGETVAFDISECMEADLDYAVRATSTEPVALMLENGIGGTLTATEAFYPGAALDASGRSFDGPLHRAFGPIVGVGPDTASTLAVNVPGDAAADVTVTWYSVMSGISTDTGRICAGCVDTFELTGTTASSGFVHVEAAGINGAEAPRIDAAYSSITSAERPQEMGFAYALVPQSLAEEANAEGAMTLPFLLRDLPNTGTTAMVSVASFDNESEPDAAAIHYFEANDHMSTECESISEGFLLWLAENSDLRVGSMGSGALTSSTGFTSSEGNVAVATMLLTGTSGQPIAGDEVAVHLASSLLVPPAAEPMPLGLDPCDFEPVARNQEAPAERAVAARAAVRLPVISFLGQNDSCNATITVENTGADPMYAIVVLWGEGGFCPPQCAGPLLITRSDAPIAPGDTWDLEAFSAASAVVYGVKALTMTEAGAVPGGPEPAAEVLRDAVFLEVTDDCDDMRRFEVAWAGGDTFLGVPLGPLATDVFEVSVARSCPDFDPGVAVDSVVAGIASARFDTLSSLPGRRIQSVTPIETGDDVDTHVYVQNAGARCTTVTLTWHTSGNWDEARSCTMFWLAPGEVWPIDSSDCTVSGWIGSVVIESEEPLAVVAEILTPGLSRIAMGRSLSIPFDLNGDGAVDLGDVAVLEAAMGSSRPQLKGSADLHTHAALGSSPTDAEWNWLADLDADGAVDADDLALLLDNLDEDVARPTPTDVPDPDPTAPVPTTSIYLPATYTVFR